MTPAVVMRPILEVEKKLSANHRAPSGPFVIPTGLELGVGSGNSVIAPVVVMRPILLPLFSVNHRAPSGPTVMPNGKALGVGKGYSVKTPAVVTRPILLVALFSANQKAPSGPLVMSAGKALAVGMVNSLNRPCTLGVVVACVLCPPTWMPCTERPSACAPNRGRALIETTTISTGSLTNLSDQHLSFNMCENHPLA